MTITGILHDAYDAHCTDSRISPCLWQTALAVMNYPVICAIGLGDEEGSISYTNNEPSPQPTNNRLLLHTYIISSMSVLYNNVLGK
jgi:hypothetical protein